MVQIEVYVPNRDRDGNLIFHERYERALIGFEATLLESAGGYSQYYVQGAWLNQETGKVMHETTAVYRVLTERGSDAHQAIHNWVREHQVLLNQEAILVTEQEINAEFFTG